MAFQGKRKGFNVSDHLRFKSTNKLRMKLDRMKLTRNNIKVANIILGILKSRGEQI